MSNAIENSKMRTINYCLDICKEAVNSTLHATVGLNILEELRSVENDETCVNKGGTNVQHKLDFDPAKL